MLSTGSDRVGVRAQIDPASHERGWLPLGNMHTADLWPAAVPSTSGSRSSADPNAKARVVPIGERGRVEPAVDEKPDDVDVG